MKTTFLVYWSASRVSNLTTQPWLEETLTISSKYRTHLILIEHNDNNTEKRIQSSPKTEMF